MSGVMDCYHNLANAIVLQAVEDYIILLKNKNKYHLGDYTAIDRCEEWFHSAQFAILTDLDPDVVIGRLRERYLK